MDCFSDSSNLHLATEERTRSGADEEENGAADRSGMGRAVHWMERDGTLWNISEHFLHFVEMVGRKRGREIMVRSCWVISFLEASEAEREREREIERECERAGRSKNGVQLADLRYNLRDGSGGREA